MKVFPSGGFQTSGFVWALFRELIPTAAVGWLGGFPFWTQLNNHTWWVWRQTKNSTIMVPVGLELNENLTFSKKKKQPTTVTAYSGTHCQDDWDKWKGLKCPQPMKFMYFFIYDVKNEKKPRFVHSKGHGRFWSQSQQSLCKRSKVQAHTLISVRTLFDCGRKSE